MATHFLPEGQLDIDFTSGICTNFPRNPLNRENGKVEGKTQNPYPVPRSIRLPTLLDNLPKTRHTPDNIVNFYQFFYIFLKLAFYYNRSTIASLCHFEVGLFQ